MKKWTALLLALVLSLSLLPTAALADTTPTTGIYLNQELTGGCISATQNSDNVWGYWNIPYTSGSETVLYYYDETVTSFSCEERGVSIESAGDHLWELSISQNAGFGDFTAGFEADQDGFPISFQDTYQPPIAKQGLYFKRLVEHREESTDKPVISKEGDYLPLSKIELAPFVDRMSMALYYYDETDYVPVNRVRLPAGSGFDIVKVNEQVRKEYVQNKNNWYYLSAYDFAESELYYYTGQNYNDSDAKPTGAIELNSHQFPPVAFYASDDEPSEGAYRMYTVMDKNTNTGETYKDYKYSTTLYLRSTNNITFTDEEGKNTITCFQKQYDDRSYENEEKPYDGFKAESNLSDDDKTLAVTIYANDTDLLLRLYGPKIHAEGCEDPENCDDPYAYVSYVNLLAPENTQIHLNDQGFEAAKYLPKHLFQQLKDKNLSVTLTAGDYAADVTCDPALTADIANANGNATLEIKGVDAEDLTQTQKDAIASANADAMAVNAVDITLAYGGEAQHKLDGSATVSYPCQLELADGETVQVYYVSDSGETELIDAVYENGCVTFTTTHFSTFVIVTVPAKSDTPDNDPPSAPSYSEDNSEPTYSVKLEAEGIQSSRRTAKEGELVTLTVKNGYDITDILVTDRNGNPVKVTYRDGKYTFRMPRGKITVTAVYISETPNFSDVDADYWALSAIRWAAEQGFMTGLTASTFAPEGAVSRQQMWMIFARLTGANPTDMAAARRWAMDNGISDGSAPGAAVTRQQLVTLLYRYAVRMGNDVSVGEDTNILSYRDAFDVADYAVAAFQWACGTGVIGGTTPDTLSPLGGATRAQLAVILSRFCGAAL